MAIDQTTIAKGRFDGRVPPGVRAVLVTAPGKIAHKVDLDLKDGETRSVNVSLEGEKQSGAVWPWIVGGAAVVAGAAIGGYLLFKSEPQAAAAPPDQLGSVHVMAFEGR